MQLVFGFISRHSVFCCGLLISAVEGSVVKAINSEAVCKAAWLAGRPLPAVRLSYKHCGHFTLAHSQYLGLVMLL